MNNFLHTVQNISNCLSIPQIRQQRWLVNEDVFSKSFDYIQLFQKTIWNYDWKVSMNISNVSEWNPIGNIYRITVQSACRPRAKPRQENAGRLQQIDAEIHK